MTGAMTEMIFAWEWAGDVDQRFTHLHGNLYCANEHHEPKGLEEGMTGLAAWIRDHWACDTPAPASAEPAEPALIRPYLYASGAAPAVGVASVPAQPESPAITWDDVKRHGSIEAATVAAMAQPELPAFADPPKPCVITGLVDCAERGCELHYTLAPVVIDLGLVTGDADSLSYERSYGWPA
jgi:hypothetical protein